MANLQHRTARNANYNLRGHAPAVIAPTQSATQRAKDAAAKRVRKNWPITRVNRRSRGLQRKFHNTCFLLSALQALLHLPKFLHWITSHNSTRRDGTINFPCRGLNDIVQDLTPDDEWAESLKLRRCPACVVKQFAEAYWGNVDVAANGAPLAWAHAYPEMTALRDLDSQLYSVAPGAAHGNDDQQDPEEFQGRILAACLASTDHK
jgi:hypothetical protein